MKFGRGRANRGINYSYGYAELLTHPHVKKKSGKNIQFSDYKKGIYFLTFNSDITLLVEVI